MYGLELASPPSDGITAVRFSDTQADALLVSSWDQSVRLYNVALNIMRYSSDHGAPVLDCCFAGGEGRSMSGGLDAKLKLHDMEHGSTSVVGAHEKPIRCVLHLDDLNAAVSGSWDGTACVWDMRQVGSGAPVHRLPQEGKVFSMSSVGNKLVIATSERRIAIYDTRNLSQPETTRESSLKYQTRVVRCFPDGKGYAIGSVEGRVAMEYFEQEGPGARKKFAFKCHRRTEGGKEYVYPVNAISFHPQLGTFATGGCDGVVNVWDGANKKRLYQYARYKTGVADLCFNRDGTKLAVAASYTFEQGEKDHALDSIFVRDVNDQEVRPKISGKPTA